MKNYVGFSGRVHRKEYWILSLFHAIIIILLSIIDGVMGSSVEDGGFGILTLIYLLAVFLPSIGVIARHLHDTNRSGWWQLLTLIPLIGSIVLLVFTVMEGTRGDNRFGVDRKRTSVNQGLNRKGGAGKQFPLFHIYWLALIPPGP
ncbi:DUF805 domain-containing protein [Neisseria weixii]|uniref:DUF805 domain-containing protein n=1 Tax=Neisseria weixii TaxID=1853276 RepID=UPI0021083246|nr:DUF805 domain-containing protein [Neisseria weixii]